MFTTQIIKTVAVYVGTNLNYYLLRVCDAYSRLRKLQVRHSSPIGGILCYLLSKSFHHGVFGPHIMLTVIPVIRKSYIWLCITSDKNKQTKRHTWRYFPIPYAGTL